MGFKHYVASILVGIFVLASPLMYGANLLKNTSQLQVVLQKVSKRPEVKGYENLPPIRSIERRESKRIDGYTMEVAFQTRAQMFGATSSGQTVSEIYYVPTTILFPDNPNNAPAIFVHNSLEVNENVKDEVLGTREVKASMDGLIKGEDTFMKPWEHGDKFTAEFKYVDGKMNMIGYLDVSEMDEDEAFEFLDVYVGRISGLNANIERENRLAYEEYSEREDEAIEARQKALLKEKYKKIKDIDAFQSIVSWRLNRTLFVEEPYSEFGHWEYENADADEDENVFVEVINYGDQFQMMFFVEYDEDLNDSVVTKIVNKISEELSGEEPKGAVSVVVEPSEYVGLIAVKVDYSLEKNPKGSEIQKWGEEFDDFVKSWYRDLRDISDRY